MNFKIGDTIRIVERNSSSLMNCKGFISSYCRNANGSVIAYGLNFIPKKSYFTKKYLKKSKSILVEKFVI